METVDDLKPLDLNEIAQMADNCNATYIYCHWSAGHYGHVYPDYHLSIDYNGRIYAPYNNTDLNQYRQHTWLRNTRAIGIALCGCYGAVANQGYNMDMGYEPITDTQIEALCAVVATICKHAGIPVDNVLTHCEAALEDGYGPYQGDPDLRWDLWYVKDYDGVMRAGGDVIRGKVRWYLQHM